MGVLCAALFNAVHLLINKGIFYCIAALVSHAYLKFTRYFFGHRFNNYNFFIDDDAEKLSYYVPKEEYELEYPQKASHLETNRDSVFLMGVNSQSESLAVRISRKPHSHVRCSIVLRLSDGRTFVLPDDHIIQKETDETNTFGSARFKVQCLSPMRRWRVFFNGTLKEESIDGVSKDRFLHVKFSFLWVASSDVFDYSTDMCTSLLTDTVAAQATWRWPPILLIQRLKHVFNNYEQCGMMLGTVTLEGEPEKEVYLWGCRGHYMSRTAAIQEGNFEDIYVNSENGTFIHFGLMNIPGMLKNFCYGFVMRPNGYIFPIEKHHVLEEDSSGKSKTYRCFSQGQEYTVQVTKENIVIKADGVSSITHAGARLNVMNGRGIIYQSKIQALKDSPTKKQKVRFTGKNEKPRRSVPLLSLSLDDSCCQLPDLTGGKGSSLAKLVHISAELKNFTVPKGLVVTTSAYKRFIGGSLKHAIQKFEKDAWKMTKDNIQAQCQRLVEQISNSELPEIIKLDVEKNLKDVFGSELETTKFAVRSSATGEDTEQMSAAGQMETFLGLSGLTEIFEGLKKCWASQFSYIAIEYKRRYGQPLNTPMAVVIQQMVACDASGVIFTCDPVTGNPAKISITANYGLGESVVGASVDPDTVTLARDEYDGISIHSQSVGKKKSKIVMDESGGTREIHMEEVESNEYSISRETAFFLGEIAVKIEEIFGNPRDIEWGTLDGDIYLFQSRPVTSLDIETDFEIKHSFDSHMRREDEYSTTANVGEVFPGATSPIGICLVMRNFDISCARQKYVKWEGEAMSETSYIAKRVVATMGHPFFCIADAFFRFSETEGDEISNLTKAMTVAIFGRVVDDKKILDMAKDRHQGTEEHGMSLVGKIYAAVVMFFGGYFVRRTANRLEKFKIPVKRGSSTSENLRTISRCFYNLADVTNVHIDSLFSSAFWNNAILGLLSKAKGAWDNDVFGDFAYLLSTCTHVESADVPSAIQKLGFAISQCMEPEEFKKMNTEEVVEWLQSSPSEAGVKFREFLKKHGHRCLKEFDVFVKTWGQDPKPLVKVLQGMVGKDIKNPEEKDTVSFGTIVNHLNVRLGFLDRLKLRFLLPNCQRGVRTREFSKSTMIKAYHKFRVAFHLLADEMVREGRLPNREMMFFLDMEELRQLLKTRSPRIVATAFRRWKIHPELDRLIFPEIMSGIPRPINMNEDVTVPGNGFAITGVPVSQGVAIGTARVVLNLEDAHQIQPGDVLITYSTDIGWSPYFVLLSGVATEIGGLISHGAVVAREYGLPCVVNVHGASRAFKSGDQVLLDGNKGILQKIESA